MTEAQEKFLYIDEEKMETRLIFTALAVAKALFGLEMEEG